MGDRSAVLTADRVIALSAGFLRSGGPAVLVDVLQDQRDLAQLFAQLSAMRCLCMLSNSDTPFVHELYEEFRVEIVQANRPISQNAAGRGAINEVVVLNY